MLAGALLLVTFAFSPRETTTPAPSMAMENEGNAYAVEICKEILPVRPDFDNLGQCVKLFATCGENLDPAAGNFAACFCEILELNELLGVAGYDNYGDCVQDFKSADQ
ncbi:hypothetical protein CRP01_30415 [Flavilitoribacter nigricans DSM 23189 = NBRC 102662]|uniref:Uncharacterized protein n=2 Tax=Flavilitoribacter TaxID=2762562 RepID=A0A2D0N3H6_FLAN2|nr:hypothetical protein CRP01_30415 [Flavilitoribacter nigricans DSM 23189 = NBRC 102662]